MNTLVRRDPQSGEITELPPGQDVLIGEGADALLPSYATVLQWTDAERAAHGLYAGVKTPPEPPEGERVASVSWAYDDAENRMVQIYTYEPVPPPVEVAMHKVHKAALLTPWGENGSTNLKAAIEAAFEQLPSPSNVLARIEWDKAPNLVRDGATTAAVVAILGMTETQRDELLIFAATLP